MTKRAQIFYYAPKAKAHEFLEAGWEAHPKTLDGTHHGEYSVVMEWTKDDEPVMPPREDK